MLRNGCEVVGVVFLQRSSASPQNPPAFCYLNGFREDESVGMSPQPLSRLLLPSATANVIDVADVDFEAYVTGMGVAMGSIPNRPLTTVALTTLVRSSSRAIGFWYRASLSLPSVTLGGSTYTVLDWGADCQHAMLLVGAHSRSRAHLGKELIAPAGGAAVSHALTIVRFDAANSVLRSASEVRVRFAMQNGASDTVFHRYADDSTSGSQVDREGGTVVSCGAGCYDMMSPRTSSFVAFSFGAQSASPTEPTEDDGLDIVVVVVPVVVSVGLLVCCLMALAMVYGIPVDWALLQAWPVIRHSDDTLCPTPFPSPVEELLTGRPGVYSLSDDAASPGYHNEISPPPTPVVLPCSPRPRSSARLGFVPVLPEGLDAGYGDTDAVPECPFEVGSDEGYPCIAAPHEVDACAAPDFPTELDADATEFDAVDASYAAFPLHVGDGAHFGWSNDYDE